MITIQVAGAGAGKTYGLAETILSLIQEKGNDVKIFALTYTNSAKRKIETEIIKQNGSYPENLRIETVHSFLLDEIVFPFSNYILNEKYSKASIIVLNSTPALKAYKIKYLKNRSIIHADKVYEKAKLIIDKNCSRNRSKKQKSKVEKVISFINSSVDYIFVDEAQDLNKDALRVFEILSVNNINIHILGDPKQAIKYSRAFTEFIESIENKDVVEREILPPNNISRRLPQKVLSYSNQFCYERQEQITINEKKGSVSYIRSTDSNFDLKMHAWINDKNTLVYIDKSQGAYSTSKEGKLDLPDEIKEKIILSNTKRDSDLLIKVACVEFSENASKNINNDYPARELIKKYAIGKVGSQLYAELCELAKKNSKTESKYIVSSIDSVKGLEAETCVFILSPTTIKYFFQQINNDKKFNKEWKKIYVALTRTENRLIFVIDDSMFKPQDMKSIKMKLREAGINKLESFK